MLLEHDWQASAGEPPETGTWLEVSGDPDRPVLRGVVARHQDGEDGITILSILMPDGQNGTKEFQAWVLSEGDFGIQVAGDQTGLPVL